MCEFHRKHVNLNALGCRHLLSGASPSTTTIILLPTPQPLPAGTTYPAHNIPNLELQILAKGPSLSGINHILSLMASETRLTLALSYRRYGG